MSASIVVLLPIPLLLVAGLLGLAVALARRPTPPPSQAAEVARRHGLVVNSFAWAAWLVLPIIVGVASLALIGPRLPSLGVIAALWPSAAGLLFLAVHAIGDRTWPRPDGPVRRAALVPRQLADVVPLRLRTLTYAWAGLLVVALLAGGTTADPSGRSLTRALMTSGGYPGWYYGVPLLVATVLLLAATQAVLRLIAARPAIVDTDPEYDAGSRQLSAHRVLRGSQLALGGTLGGVVLAAGRALQFLGQSGLGGTLAILGILIAGIALVVAAVPGQPPTTEADRSVEAARGGST